MTFRRSHLRPRVLGLLLALAACSHSEPFDPPDTELDGPLAGGEPTRLTYGDAVGDAAWTTDGSSIIYAGGRHTGDRLDRCLNILPAGGGTVRREICNPSIFDESITDIFGNPVVSADEQLAFYYANAPGGGTPAFQGIYATTIAAPAVTTPVRSIPFLGADGIFYKSISHLRWLSASEIVFIAHAEAIVVPCAGCDAEVYLHPRTLFRAVAVAGAELTPVPGTAFATSVAAGASSDQIYFTLANDARIYHLLLSTGAASIVHDFGGAGIARDVHFGGGRLTAIVGGRVRVVLDAIGPLQTGDSGGHLYLLEPATGAVTRLTDDSRWFRRPALSPTGGLIVGEGFAVSIGQDPNAPPEVLDTTVSPVGDLWRYGTP